MSFIFFKKCFVDNKRKASLGIFSTGFSEKFGAIMSGNTQYFFFF